MPKLFQKNSKQKNAYTSAWSNRELVGIKFWNFIWNTLFRFSPKKMGNPFRLFLLRLFGADIDSSVFIYPSAKIYIPWNLIMRSRSCLGPNSEIYNLGNVFIGERSTISQYSYVCNGSHDLTLKSLPLLIGNIKIGNDVFIGAKVIIMPGICIDDFAVVGAGSVVTKDINKHEIFAGNPAKFIKKRIMND